jgi:hypothetical protein
MKLPQIDLVKRFTQAVDAVGEIPTNKKKSV